MSAGAELPFLKKSALFERLALGRAAGVTVVTPNQRLSQALMPEFDAFQIGKALSVWEAPDILPFGAFVQRLYEDGLYADLSGELPMLLTPAQEEELWKQVVGGSGLLAVEGAAAKCRDAWNLANLWRIRPGAGNQDTEAFARWLTLYKKKTEEDLEAGRPVVPGREVARLRAAGILHSLAHGGDPLRIRARPARRRADAANLVQIGGHDREAGGAILVELHGMDGPRERRVQERDDSDVAAGEE